MIFFGSSCFEFEEFGMDIINRLLATLFLLNVNSYQGQCGSYPPGVHLPGCFRGTGRGRDMGPIDISRSYKPAVCIKACVEKKYLYAGKQKTMCRCGNTYGRLPKVDPKRCSATCMTGVPKGECGGHNLFTVYSLLHYYKDKPCKKIPEALRGSWYASTEPERQVVIFTNAILWRSTDKKDTFSAYVEVESIYCVSPVVARVVGRLHGESKRNHVCITLKAGTDAAVNATVTRTDKEGPSECEIPESTSDGLYEEFALSERPLPKQIAFSPLGCFLDTFFQRRMMYDSLYSQQPMTKSLCSRYCHVRQTYYFALRDTYWCDCGFIIPDKPEKKCEAGCGLKSDCKKYKYSILMFKFDNVQKASAAEVKKHELGVYVEQNKHISNGLKYLTAYKKTGTLAMVGETCYMLCGFYNMAYPLVQHRSDHAICYCNSRFDMKKVKTAKSLDRTLKFDWRKKKVATNAWVMFTMYRPDFRRPEYERKTKPLPDAPPSSVLTQVLSKKKLAEDLIHNVDIWSGRAKGFLRKRASNVVQISSVANSSKVKVDAQHVDVVDQLPGNGSDGTAAALQKIKDQVGATLGDNPMIKLGAVAAGLVVIVIIIIICCKKKKSKPEISPEIPPEERVLLHSVKPVKAPEEEEGQEETTTREKRKKEKEKKKKKEKEKEKKKEKEKEKEKEKGKKKRKMEEKEKKKKKKKKKKKRGHDD